MGTTPTMSWDDYELLKNVVILTTLWVRLLQYPTDIELTTYTVVILTTLWVRLLQVLQMER